MSQLNIELQAAYGTRYSKKKMENLAWNGNLNGAL